MPTVKVTGVPEHFNYPWRRAFANDAFNSHRLQVIWHEEPSGTGAMCQALQEGKADMAMLLTEGAIAHIAIGCNFKILQWYVVSPLVWGIYAKYGSTILKTNIFEHRIAVSRLGSGSHLMPMIHADEEGYSVDPSQFVIVHNLMGAIETISQEQAQIFYWEKFTTQYLVDEKVFSKIHEYPTPWPCFVWVVRVDFFNNYPLVTRYMQQVLNENCAQVHHLPGMHKMIAQEYNMNETLAQQWLETVKWACTTHIEYSDLELVALKLSKIGIIAKIPSREQMLF